MTTRFLSSRNYLNGLRSPDDLGERFRSMPVTDYLECRDRDALHLLNALDAGEIALGSGHVLGFLPAQLLDRLDLLDKGVQKQPGEFCRRADADGSGDKGLPADALAEMIAVVRRLCERANEKKQPLMVLVGYSRHELGLPCRW